MIGIINTSPACYGNFGIIPFVATGSQYETPTVPAFSLYPSEEGSPFVVGDFGHASHGNRVHFPTHRLFEPKIFASSGTTRNDGTNISVPPGRGGNGGDDSGKGSGKKSIKLFLERIKMDRKKFNAKLQELIRIGNIFEQRRWFLGTSGNMSVLLRRSPASLAITASGSDKGNLEESSFVIIDDDGKIYADETASENFKPSHEHSIHSAIYRLYGAECVIHVHVLSALLAADLFGGGGDVSIEGLEVLKGLGCRSASDCLKIPTINNNDDPAEIARQIKPSDNSLTAPAILVRRHGLFVWGKSIFEAKRHVELLVHAFEYLVAKENLGKS